MFVSLALDPNVTVPTQSMNESFSVVAFPANISSRGSTQLLYNATPTTKLVKNNNASVTYQGSDDNISLVTVTSKSAPGNEDATVTSGLTGDHSE